MSIKPSGSIDSYLLQGLATFINAYEIRDTIRYNPFISTRTLPVKEPTGGDHPVIISEVGLALDWGKLTSNLRDDIPWVILASEEHNSEIEQHILHTQLITLPKDAVAVWEKPFWEGKSCISPKLWHTPIHVYASPAVTVSQHVCVELFYFNSSDVLGLDLTLQWGGLLKNTYCISNVVLI
jgi:hypothetical protein